MSTSLPHATASTQCRVPPSGPASFRGAAFALALAFGQAGCSSGGGVTGGANSSIEPAESMDVSMEVGGQALPQPKAYEWINTSDAPHPFRVVVSQPWVQVAPAADGTIPPRNRVQITLGIEPVASRTLAVGRHAATVSFVDALSGREFDSRAVNLEVRPQQQVQGWTDLRPSADTRTVYVSNSQGNDANTGLDESSPKRTISAGRALMRQGFPDWLLLKRGDVWQESINAWTTGGRSAQEPQVIGSYGTAAARPLLRTGNSNGIYMTGANTPLQLDNLALVGLHFHAHTYTGAGSPKGLEYVHAGSNHLIEDCCFEGYHTNVVVMGWPTGRFRNVRIRRNVIIDAYTTENSHSQGMFFHAIDGLLIDENVIDHNGWNENIAGAGGTIFRHSIYVQYGCTNVVVQRNIISNSASHGLQLRPGGVANDNLFLRNSISLMFGAVEEPNGVTVEARRNVILDGKNIDAANPRGWGMTLAYVASGVVSHNIVANNTIGAQPVPVEIFANTGIGVRNLTFERNIVSNWAGAVNLRGTPAQFPNLVFRGNELQNRISGGFLLEHSSTTSIAGITSADNRLYSASAAANAWILVGSNSHSVESWRLLLNDTSSSAAAISYPNPNASVGTYNATLSGQATHAAFMAEARKQARTFWRDQYTALAVNNYVRTAFGLTVP